MADLGKIRIPLSAYAEASLLVEKVCQQLRRVTCPALIIQARADELVSPHHVEMLYEALASGHKELFWLEHSGHVALFDNDRELVASRAIVFIERCISEY